MNGAISPDCQVLKSVFPYVFGKADDCCKVGANTVGCDADGKVTRIKIHDISINGPLPEALFKLDRLSGLTLNRAGLEGPIPDMFHLLPNLLHLSLQSNRLTGSIPSSLGRIKNLKMILLNDNQLSGPLPSFIGNNTNLKMLRLSKNQFQGRIPESYGQLVDLAEFDVGSNQLSGIMPESIANLTKLTKFQVQDNDRLKGVIPSRFANIKECFAKNTAMCVLDSSHIPICDVHRVCTDIDFLDDVSTLIDTASTPTDQQSDGSKNQQAQTEMSPKPSTQSMPGFPLPTTSAFPDDQSPNNPTDKSQVMSPLWIGVIVVLLVVVIICAIVASVVVYRRRQKQNKRQKPSLPDSDLTKHNRHYSLYDSDSLPRSKKKDQEFDEDLDPLPGPMSRNLNPRLYPSRKPSQAETLIDADFEFGVREADPVITGRIIDPDFEYGVREAGPVITGRTIDRDSQYGVREALPSSVGVVDNSVDLDLYYGVREANANEINLSTKHE